MAHKHRFKTEKLVRDKTKERLLTKGTVSFDRILEPAEYLQCLKNKLVEEAQEVAEATTMDEYLAELADVLEVIHALTTTVNVSYEQVEQKWLDLKEARGGFEGHVYSTYVEIDADNKDAVDYCRNRPHKYPEMK